MTTPPPPGPAREVALTEALMDAARGIDWNVLGQDADRVEVDRKALGQLWGVLIDVLPPMTPTTPPVRSAPAPLDLAAIEARLAAAITAGGTKK